MTVHQETTADVGHLGPRRVLAARARVDGILGTDTAVPLHVRNGLIRVVQAMEMIGRRYACGAFTGLDLAFVLHDRDALLWLSAQVDKCSESEPSTARLFRRFLDTLSTYDEQTGSTLMDQEKLRETFGAVVVLLFAQSLRDDALM